MTLLKDQDALLEQIRAASAENSKLFAQIEVDRKDQAQQQIRLNEQILKAQERYESAQRVSRGLKW